MSVKELEEVKMDVLCISDQDLQRWVSVVDNTSKFRAIHSIVNSPLMS